MLPNVSVFQMIMEYLYKGGFDGIAVSPQDALELLTASNYFQLTPLVTYCENICTKVKCAVVGLSMKKSSEKKK